MATQNWWEESEDLGAVGALDNAPVQPEDSIEKPWWEDSEDLGAVEETPKIPSLYDEPELKSLSPEFNVPKQPPESILRQAGDIPVQFAIGVNNSIKGLTDLFGADNAVSQNLNQNVDWYRSLLSASAKEDEAEISRIMEAAENEGIGGQLMAGLEAFTVAPVDFISSGLGSLATFAIGGAAGRAAGLGMRGIQTVQAGMGAGMGAGIAKGEIYQSVKDEMISQGKTEEEARSIAMEAQSFGGKNLDQILLAAGLGAASAYTGAESIISKVLTKGGISPTASRIGNALKGGITEGVPEFAQAAQEAVASNLALQREGVDVPITQGVFARGALEGLAGVALGAGAGAIEPRVEAPTTQEVNAAASETKDVARQNMDVAPATATLVERQAETFSVNATVSPRREGETDQEWRARIEQERTETPEQRLTRLQEEARVAAEIPLEEEPVVAVEPTVTPAAITPTPEVSPEVTPETPNLEPLRRVARAEQTPEDVPSLLDAGLVEVYKDQPVLTEAGIAQLPEAERPKLTPEARKIQIDTGATDAAAEAISKNLRIGVEQVPFDVKMPAGWTLVEDIYVPPKPMERITEFTITPEYDVEETADVFASVWGKRPRIDVDKIVADAQAKRQNKPFTTSARPLTPKEFLEKSIRTALKAAAKFNFNPATRKSDAMFADIAAILAEAPIPALDDENIIKLSSRGYRGREKRFWGGDIGMASTKGMSIRTFIHEIGHSLTADQLRKYGPQTRGAKPINGKEYIDQLRTLSGDDKIPQPVRDIFTLYVSTIDQLGLMNLYGSPKGLAGTPNPDVSMNRALKLQSEGKIPSNFTRGDFYALANIYEFVSQTFSSKSFQDKLKNLKSPINANKTLWQEFITAIRQIFGFPSDSMAAAVVEATVEISMSVPAARLSALLDNEGYLVGFKDALELKNYLEANPNKNMGDAKDDFRKRFNKEPDQFAGQNAKAFSKPEIESEIKKYQKRVDEYRKAIPSGTTPPPSPAPEVRESRREQPVVLKNRFYSQLERTVAAKMPNVSSPEQLKAIIDPNRGSGVKPEEIKWSGITEAIDRIAVENNGRVPKEAIIKYMQDEGRVKFEEVTMQDWIAKRDAVFADYDAGIIDMQERNARLMKVENESRPTRFGQYQLPAGENYREVVMAMPSVETAYEIYRSDNGKLLKTVPESSLEVELNESRKIQKMADNDPAIVRSRKTKKTIQSKNLYTSTHFPSVPNYVAHMRLNERKDSEGNNGLFIEEIQSDRHQAGREKGYVGEVEQRFFAKESTDPRFKGMWYVANEKGTPESSPIYTKEVAEADAARLNNQGTVPDAPFRKDWPLQMFKRALEEAVASGKDWIGWTTGETQADRYDLSKQISEVAYNVDRKSLFAYDKKGEAVLVQEDVPQDKIAEYIGKEAAQRLIDAPKEDSRGGVMQRLKGEGLRVGGEGMKGFYDNILPKEIAKYVKKWGATVEKSKLDDPDETMTYEGLAAEGLTMREYNALPRDRAKALRKKYTIGIPIWRVNITPEMRRIIEEEGQALFSLQMPSKITGMETEVVATKLESLGFGRGGIVSVVNEPDASFEGRTIIRDGKVVGIELNAAALKDDAAVERVLNHEIAESANADGALNNLVAGLTPKERKEINDAITRLGYAERARTAEEAARAVELLAEGWKGRRWFERAVARVEAWANKLGYKLTRRAAEYIAARNVSEINEEFKQAYNNFIDVSGEPREARVGAQAVVDADMGRRSQTELTPQEIEQLESGEKIRVYRAMQVIDGKLYPPMSALVGGKLRKPTEIGTWEKAEERPDLLDKKGKFVLQKGNKATVPAAYNPYFHTSSSPLNDQFSSAYKRDNLVTVEVEVPASELTSGYKAEGAKDAVGEVRWNAGPVSSKLPADKKRKVILSRYAKVLRIVPDSEVAGIISNLLEGTNLSIPENTVTPSLKAELEKKGIAVTPRPARGEEIRESRREDAIPTFSEGSPEASTLSTMSASMAKVDEASEGKPNPENKPTYKISEIASVWMDQGGDTRQLQDMVVEYTNLTPANAKKVANAIARQYDIQQSIATAFVETPMGLSVEALPEGVTLPKEVDPDRPRPVMQRLFDVFMGVRVPPVKITVNEKTALKDQIRLKAAANRAAKKAQQETTAEVIDVIKAMDMRGPVRPKQVQALTKRAASVIWTNEKSVERFVDYAARVVENANYDADLREAKAAQKRAKELSKQKKVAMSPQREVLENIGKIAVGDVDDPRLFADYVNYYLRAFKSVVSPEYVVMPDSEMNSYLSQVEDETVARKMDREEATNQRLAEKYGVSLDEVKSVLESNRIIEDLEAAERREELDKLLTEKAVDARDSLKTYDMAQLRETQRDAVKAIMDTDPAALNAEERQRLIRIVNNVIYNNQTNGAKYFIAVAKGQQNARKAAKDETMVAKNRAWINLIPRLIASDKTQRGWSIELQSVADTFRNAFGKGAMGKIYDIMGMLDLNSGFSKANNTIDEIQEEMAKFHRGLEKKYKKSALNQDGILSEGVVGFLIQGVPNKSEADSIVQRRNLIKQDIDSRRSSGDLDKIAMADRIEAILNQVDGSSKREILGKMEQVFKPNHESLVWYKDVLLPKYKDFLKEFDESFNDQANNYDNPDYLPIGFMSGGPSLAITPEEEQVFFDHVSLRPKQSANTIKRVDYSVLPKDRTTGRPKEIEFNLRRNAFESLSDQINKAYTSESWQQIASFMKTPESEQVFGGAANKDFFVERLNKLRLSRMRRGAMSRGNIEKAVDSLSVIARKLGTGIALGGAYQWIKQPPDQLITAIGSGGRVDLLAKHLIRQKDAIPLLKKVSIGRRGDASSGYKYINQMEGHQNRLERYFSESKWEQVKEQAGKIADVWMVALKQSDFLAASAAWMTYYEQKLRELDVRIDDWGKESDLVETDPKRKEALAYAELMTDIYQGSSDPTSMATFAQSGKSGWENFAKSIFVPFNSFAIQQRMRIYSDARDAINGTAGGTTGLAGTVGGLVLFHLTKRLVIPTISGLGAAALYAMLGVDMDEPDEEKQKEQAEKAWRQLYGDVTANLLVGGTPQVVESGLVNAVNYANYLVSLQLESESVLDDDGEVMSFDKYSKERSPFYRYQSYDNAMSLGMFDILPSQAVKVATQAKMLADPEKMEMFTPEETRLLYFSALSEFLLLMRLNDTDMARLVDKARRDMIKAAKEREKEATRIRAL